MDDHTTSVSYSVFSNKGAFALLLGSGVSRSAGIPTGWEVVLGLIRQVAILEKSDCEPDPEKWFSKHFGKEPDYSDLLESLTNTQPERVNLLRAYFEPDETEREEGLKKPTLAHKMIAQLVSKGYIRVIVTTNFDRLMENALKDIGIEPVVVSNPGHTENTLPIVHSPITIIKINGDYLDTSLLNIKSELDNYDHRLEDLLRFVFENFGLITCGWSATWDIALGEALRSSNKFRFSNYFTFVGKPTQELASLASLRRGKTIAITGADSFFRELHENVEALETGNSGHPLTPQIALARLKKYVVREEHIISLHDLVKEDVDRVYGNFGALSVKESPTHEALKQRIDYYFLQCGTLCSLFLTGIYWGKGHHHDIWIKSLVRFANRRERDSWIDVWSDLERLPALIFLYSIGLASLLRKDYGLLSRMLSLTVYSRYGTSSNITKEVNIHTPIEQDLLKKLLGSNEYVPMSQLLFKNLKPCFDPYISRQEDYERLFDVFEYFLALTFMEKVDKSWGPVGRFGYRIIRNGKENAFESFIEELEAQPLDKSLELFSPNLFKDLASLKKAEECFRQYLTSFPLY